MYQMNRILFWDGAHRETVGTVIGVLRAHVTCAEAQVTTANLWGRATWPIAAARTDCIQGTSACCWSTRINVSISEGMPKISHSFLVFLSIEIPSWRKISIYIPFWFIFASIIITVSCESRPSIRFWGFISYWTWIINCFLGVMIISLPCISFFII